MASFIDKLSLNSLYPTMPRGRIRRNDPYPLFERFKQEILPLLANSGLEQLIPAEYTKPSAMIEPTKPMDVIFNENNISEATRAMGAAKAIHGIDLNRNALSPYQAGQLSLRDRELEQKNELAQNKSALDAKKVAIAEFKAKNPGVKIIAQKGGNIRAIDSISGVVVQDFGPTGEMDDASRIALENFNELGQIQATGDQARKTETTRQQGRESLEEVQARHAKELAELKIDADSKTAKLPSQERTATLQKAEQAKNSNPEWSKYIKIVPGGGFTITAPGVLTGPSAEVYKAINDYIYGTTTSVAKPTVPVEKVKSKYQVEVR